MAGNLFKPAMLQIIDVEKKCKVYPLYTQLLFDVLTDS